MEWYVSSAGRQQGPMDLAAAQAFARTHPDAHVWREGFDQWLLAAAVPEFAAGGPPTLPGGGPPPLAAKGAAPTVPTQRSDEVDYELFGEDMQYVEVELDPGESAIAEAGAMMFKDPVIEMGTVFGDGSAQSQGQGFLGKLAGAGKRLVTGESLFTTVFTHTGPSGKARVGFGAPFPGTILPIPLAEYGEYLVCQKDSFLCAAKGVQIGIHFQKKLLTGLFGGEGFILQKLEGDGLVFVHAGGALKQVQLGPGQRLHVDTGCIAAFTRDVDYDIQRAGGVKTMLFGGEGLFFATLTGPGHVWLQSLPFSRLAGRMLAAGSGMGRSQGEGSLLGGIGNLLDGDGV